MKNLVIVWLMLSLLLVACEEDENPLPPTTAPNIPETSAFTPTVNAQANTLETTPTRDPNRATGVPAEGILNPTLPPAVDLSQDTATPRPTRTLAPTLELGPTATSNLNPDVTPVDFVDDAPEDDEPDDEPAPEEAPPPRLLLEYFELAVRLQSYEQTRVEDELLRSTQVVEFTDNGIELRFDMIPEGESNATNLTALVAVELSAEDGRLSMQIDEIYETNDPSRAYVGVLTQEMEDRLQRALDNLIEVEARSEGVTGAFAVVDYSETETGIEVEIIRP
ncbi:MAG: hypothetical protein ACLFTK_17455 [Anaerolineales bacterium]